MTKRLAPLLAVAAFVPGVAGCGGDGDAGDLARFAPASSMVYVEAVLRPEGELKADLEAALRKVLATDDPGAELTKAATRAFRDEDVDFRRDIEPWLGEKAAAAFTSLTGEPQGFVAVATTDEDKALASVRKGEVVTEKEHRGVEFAVSADDDASTTIDGVLLVGSERGLRAAIDASKAEEDRTLVGSARYEQAREDAEADDAAGFAYVDVARALRAVGTQASRANPQAGAVLGALDTAGLQTLGIAATADEQALRVRGALRSRRALPGGAGAAADALAAAPADSVMALGIGDIGGTVEGTLERLGGIAGAGVEALFQQIRQQQGIDVRADLLDWMGDATLFVRGSTAQGLSGALVVRSKDPARSRAAVPKLAALMEAQGLPVERRAAAGTDGAYVLELGGFSLKLASAGERVVLAFGPGALGAALRPTAGDLGQNAAFRAASGQLRDGVKAQVFLDTAKLAGLLGTRPDAAEAAQVLQRFTGIVVGGGRDGTLSRFEAIGALR